MSKFIVEIFDDVQGVAGKSANEAQLQALGKLTQVGLLSNVFTLNSTNDEIIEAITSEYYYNKGYYMFEIDPIDSFWLVLKQNKTSCQVIAEVDQQAFINGIKQDALIYCQFKSAKNQLIQTLINLQQVNQTDDLYEKLVGSLNRGSTLARLCDFYEYDCSIKDSLDFQCVFQNLYV